MNNIALIGLFQTQKPGTILILICSLTSIRVYKYKTILRRSYLYNGNPYVERPHLYWGGPYFSFKWMAIYSALDEISPTRLFILKSVNDHFNFMFKFAVKTNLILRIFSDDTRSLNSILITPAKWRSLLVEREIFYHLNVILHHNTEYSLTQEEPFFPMMTSSNGNIFRCHWPFVRVIHRSPVNYPHKGQWRGALMFSLICVGINGWVKIVSLVIWDAIVPIMTSL